MKIVPSPPSRGAWIEITKSLDKIVDHVSPPSRGAWIEIHRQQENRLCRESPPSRGAWIEISVLVLELSGAVVAPLAGGVD